MVEKYQWAEFGRLCFYDKVQLSIWPWPLCSARGYRLLLVAHAPC